MRVAIQTSLDFFELQVFQTVLWFHMLILNFFKNHRLYLAVTVMETESTLPLILKPLWCSAANTDAYHVNDGNR